jgi:hypothetical protein
MGFFSKAQPATSGEGLQVGVMYPSGDMTVLFEREGVPRVWPRVLVMAIAEQVNRHQDLYYPAVAEDLVDKPS